MKVIRFKSKWVNIVIISTACFTKNDTLFYRKRHVVLLKMTRRFVENDTLFFFDRRVVFGGSKCRVFVSMKGLKNVQCDTCDSKKTKLLWYVCLYAWACARLRMREGDFRPPLFKIVIPCPYFFHFAQDRAANSPYFCQKNNHYIYLCFWYLKMTKMRVNEFCCADFCDFFPLSSFISPYTYRAILLRCWLLHPTYKCATSTSPLTDKPVFSYSLPTS